MTEKDIFQIVCYFSRGISLWHMLVVVEDNNFEMIKIPAKFSNQAQQRIIRLKLDDWLMEQNPLEIQYDFLR